MIFRRINIGWKTKVSVIVAAVISSAMIMSLAGGVRADNEESTNGSSSCSFRSTGFTTEALFSISSMLGPASYSSCSSLGSFMYQSPDINAVLGEMSGSINPGDYVYGGATGSLAYVSSLAYDNQPVSSPAYARYVAQNIGIAQPVEASVSMSKAFSPVIIIWQNARNLAYIFMTVILLILGVLVMLRARTGGKEPVNAVMSLAGVAAALLLITFSYPIASLICDVCINVGNGLVASVLNKYINAQDVLTGLETPGSGYNIISMMTDIQKIGIGSSAETLIASVLREFNVPLGQITKLFNSVSGDPFLWSVGKIGAAASQLIFGILYSIMDNVVGNPLIMAIVSFIIFTTMARMVFGLLSAYFSLALMVAFSPIAFIGVAFPGGMASIGGWIKSIMAQALVFPTMFAMILLSAIFFDMRETALDPKECSEVVSDTAPDKASSIFNTVESGDNPCYPELLPPQFNYWPAPMGYIRGVSGDQLMRAVLGVGVLLAAPTAGAMWKELLQVRDYRFLQQIAGGMKLGVSTFGNLVSRVPSLGVGKGLGQVMQQIGSSF